MDLPRLLKSGALMRDGLVSLVLILGRNWLLILNLVFPERRNNGVNRGRIG
jgi:hypothetical protein